MAVAAAETLPRRPVYRGRLAELVHSAEMARIPMALALALAACVVGVTRAAAVKDNLPIDHPDHPDFPKPLFPVVPCPYKRLPCVPVYTESGVKRLGELGIIAQVAMVPDWIAARKRPPLPLLPPPAKEERPCRRGDDCTRRDESQPSALQSLQALQQQ